MTRARSGHAVCAERFGRCVDRRSRQRAGSPDQTQDGTSRRVDATASSATIDRAPPGPYFAS